MATPMLAVTAISCTTCTGISRMVMKPTRSASSAMMAGISNCRKVWRAASHAVDACDRGLLDGADLLHAMRHADGEDQERNEESQGIDAVTEQHQRAELPRHRHDGAHDGHHRDLQRLHVVPDGQQREQDRHHREHDHRHRAIGDVAHHLGEADHVHVDARSLRLHQHVVALDLVAHAAFEIARHFDGVDGFAGGVLLEHDGRDQRARRNRWPPGGRGCRPSGCSRAPSPALRAWARTPSRPRCRPRCRPRPLPCNARWA